MAASPRTRLGDGVLVIGSAGISAGLQAGIADGAFGWQWPLVGGVVTVLAVVVRDWFRPSIWTPWGRFWLAVEAWMVHPLNPEKRAEYEFERGFNDGDK